MKSKDLKEAEKAALVQDDQIKRMQRHLGVLEGHCDAVGDELGAQRELLGDLENQLKDMYDALGIERSSEEALGSVAVMDSLAVTEAERIEIARGLPDLSFALDVPGVSDDWDAYMRKVDEYAVRYNVNLARDPIEQMLSPRQVAALYGEFDREFGRLPWDKWDYAAIGTTVMLGALIDYFLVAIPQAMEFKGVRYEGSPVTRWMREQSETIMSGQGNQFQQWLGRMAREAETYAQVPYDISNNCQILGEVDGLRPALHRLMSPGHDPVLGVAFGVIDILRGNCTLIDRHGNWTVIDQAMRSAAGNGTGAVSNPIQALMMVMAHFYSDVFTSAGLPAPFMTVLQGLNVNTGISVKQNGAPLQMPDLLRYMYANGYDLRHFATMSIVPAVAEVAVRTYHGIRTFKNDEIKGKGGIRGRVKLAQMLLMTHGLLVSTNIVKTGLYGWNPTAFNFSQALAFGKQLFSMLMVARERDRLVQEKLYESLAVILNDAKSL